MDTTTATAAIAGAIVAGEALKASQHRNFETYDMTPALRAAANEYALSYSGSFGWMQDQRRYAAMRGGLSDARAKGVLNTLLNDVAHAARDAARKADPTLQLDLSGAPEGRFRVVLDASTTFVFLIEKATWARDMPKGTRSAKIRVGKDWTFAGFIDPAGMLTFGRRLSVEQTDLLRRALKVLVDGARDGTWLVLALSYTADCRECSFCGLDLDDERSLKVGRGQTCSKLRGLPWGDKAEPMAIVLRRAGLIAEADAADAMITAAVKSTATTSASSTMAPTARQMATARAALGFAATDEEVTTLAKTYIRSRAPAVVAPSDEGFGGDCDGADFGARLMEAGLASRLLEA